VDTEKQLTVLPIAELVTVETVDAAWDFYHSAAEESLAGAIFESEEEREAEIARTILRMVDTMDLVSDNVRQRAIGVIAKYRLYHATPEGWDSLRATIQDALPEMQSGAMSEHLAIVALGDWCEQHGVPFEIPPRKLGYLREAASALRQVIQNPELRNGEKAETIKAELDWVFNKAPSAHGEGGVRDRYRSYRGAVAQGAMVENDGKMLLVIEATPATAAAIRQRLSRLVNWDLPDTITVATGGQPRPSKVSDEQMVLDVRRVVTLTRTIVYDKETGEAL